MEVQDTAGFIVLILTQAVVAAEHQPSKVLLVLAV
jgi:hypothetical protein